MYDLTSFLVSDELIPVDVLLVAMDSIEKCFGSAGLYVKDFSNDRLLELMCLVKSSSTNIKTTLPPFEFCRPNTVDKVSRQPRTDFGVPSVIGVTAMLFDISSPRYAIVSSTADDLQSARLLRRAIRNRMFAVATIGVSTPEFDLPALAVDADSTQQSTVPSGSAQLIGQLDQDQHEQPPQHQQPEEGAVEVPQHQDQGHEPEPNQLVPLPLPDQLLLNLARQQAANLHPRLLIIAYLTTLVTIHAGHAMVELPLIMRIAASNFAGLVALFAIDLRVEDLSVVFELALAERFVQFRRYAPQPGVDNPLSLPIYALCLWFSLGLGFFM